jgi:hypothetical protein
VIRVRRQFLPVALLAIVAAFLLVPGAAMANFAVHGGYTMNTDACAGCHRAHTAASSITWRDGNGADQNALLLSTATTIDEFCYTCHGTAMLGADTNVYDGVYEADDGTGNDDTNNAFGEPLNGGGFNPTTFPTQHYGSGVLWVAYGGGATGRSPDSTAAPGITITGGVQVEISCSACHDVHGSSNYRLLKDVVAGALPTGGTGPVTVGGYVGAGENPAAAPWVISAEQGYPTGGWLLHEPGAAQMANYYPDYTDTRYAKPPGSDPTKGISGWCAACHTQYNTAGTAGNYADEVFDANDGFGLVTRHRHPVNVALSNFAGPRSLIVTALPVAHDGYADATVDNTSSDWMDCLTCHVAHGSSAVMTGYAAVADATNPEPDSSYGVTPGDGLGSVPPDDGNALLRANNRGVCEMCHNK